MAGKAIKGLTVEIGGDTTKLGRALESVDKKSRTLSSELSSINKLLKIDPTNTVLLAQKQEVLAEAISNTKGKLDILKEAEKQVQEQFERGEASVEQVRELQREIAAAESKLKRYETSSDEAAKAIDNVGDEAEAVAEDFKMAGEAADKSAEQLDDLREVSDVVAKSITAVFAATAAAVAGAVTALAQCTKEGAEYADTVLTMSTQTGIAADKLQGYMYAAELVDVSTETLARSMAKQIMSMKAVQDGNKLSADAYDKLNVSVLNADGTFRDSDTVYWEVIDALGNIENGTERDALAMQLFGESAQGLNPIIEAGAVRMRELGAEARRVGYVLDNETLIAYGEFDDAMQRLNASADAAKRTLGTTLLPILSDLAHNGVDLLRAGVAALKQSLDRIDIDKLSRKLKSRLEKLVTKVIPQLLKLLIKLVENFDTIKSAALGFLAALAVNRIIAFAVATGSKLVGAFKALKTALTGAKIAQQGMNAAAAINPYVLLAEVIIGVGTALVTYFSAKARDAKEAAYELAVATHGLTEEERAAAEAASAAADAYDGLRDSIDNSVSSITSQYSYVESLANQLLGLADANGNVLDSNRTRVEFILTKLNSALNTEYSLTGNQINQYTELKDTIYATIAAKKAELLLDSYSDQYVEALKGKSEAERLYYTNLKSYQDAKIAYEHNMARLEELWSIDRSKYSVEEQLALYKEQEAREQNVKALYDAMSESSEAYENSKLVIEGYYADIGQYEAAQMTILQGNAEETNKILTDRSYYIHKYADSMGFASDAIKNAWEQQAIDAGVSAARIKQNFEAGVDGYTQAMVDEAETGYEEAINAMGTAYEAAKGVGDDITRGLQSGMLKKRAALMNQARRMIADIIRTFRNEADSHSPSRKMIDFGADIGAGLKIGITNQTKPIIDAAKEQMRQVLRTYDQTANAQQTAMNGVSSHSITERWDASAGEQQAMMELMVKLLAAVDAGREIYLDGDKLVGGTLRRIDAALGVRRNMAIRGATV